MKTIKSTLPTGVMTSQKDKGGNIEVINENYDPIYDQRILDIDVKADIFETLNNIFKPL